MTEVFRDISGSRRSHSNRELSFWLGASAHRSALLQSCPSVPCFNNQSGPNGTKLSPAFGEFPLKSAIYTRRRTPRLSRAETKANRGNRVSAAHSAGNRCACGRGAAIRENSSIIVVILVPFVSDLASLIRSRPNRFIACLNAERNAGVILKGGNGYLESG